MRASQNVTRCDDATATRVWREIRSRVLRAGRRWLVRPVDSEVKLTMAKAVDGREGSAPKGKAEVRARACLHARGML